MRIPLRIAGKARQETRESLSHALAVGFAIVPALPPNVRVVAMTLWTALGGSKRPS